MVYEFLKLDDVVYPVICTTGIPPGWAEVDVQVDDNGYKYPGRMVAGAVGTKVLWGHGGGNDVDGDTIEPYSAWFMIHMPGETEGQ